MGQAAELLELLELLEPAEAVEPADVLAAAAFSFFGELSAGEVVVVDGEVAEEPLDRLSLR